MNTTYTYDDEARVLEVVWVPGERPLRYEDVTILSAAERIWLIIIRRECRVSLDVFDRVMESPQHAAEMHAMLTELRRAQVILSLDMERNDPTSPDLSLWFGGLDTFETLLEQDLATYYDTDEGQAVYLQS